MTIIFHPIALKNDLTKEKNEYFCWTNKKMLQVKRFSIFKKITFCARSEMWHTKYSPSEYIEYPTQELKSDRYE